MAISLMAGFAYAEEAKVGDVAPAASGEETATTTEVTPSEAPVADESTPVVPRSLLLKRAKKLKNHPKRVNSRRSQ